MAPPAAHSTRLTIDLDALAHNYAVLQAHAPGADMAPVVKADGYGLGAGPIARRLWAEGARAFFVARLSEGEALRAALTPDRPATIYVLDGLTPGTGQRLHAADLTPALTSLAQLGKLKLVGRHSMTGSFCCPSGKAKNGAVSEQRQSRPSLRDVPGVDAAAREKSFRQTPSPLCRVRSRPSWKDGLLCRPSLRDVPGVDAAPREKSFR